MSDAVVLALVLAAVVALAVVSTTALNRLRSKVWRVDEVPVGDDRVQVICRAGRKKIRIGAPVQVNRPDFNDRIEERRFEARDKVAALNSGRFWG